MSYAETITRIEGRSKKLRSKVSNGARPMLNSDGRSAWVRRYKDLVEDHVGDYGGDLSVPRMSLLRRQAASLIECELIEGRMAAGEATPEDIDRHTRIVGNVRRCYEVLGMDRIARNIDDFGSISGRVATQRGADG
jgi:hypothetical protein